jgi:hypothetical protein
VPSRADSNRRDPQSGHRFTRDDYPPYEARKRPRFAGWTLGNRSTTMNDRDRERRLERRTGRRIVVGGVVGAVLGAAVGLLVGAFVFDPWTPAHGQWRSGA